MLSRLNRSQSLISTCFFVLAVLIWHENVDAASLQLSWADNSQNEDGFDIERKTGNGGAFLALTTIPANQSSYTDTNCQTAQPIAIEYAPLTASVVHPTPTRPAQPLLLPPQLHRQPPIPSPPISPITRH